MSLVTRERVYAVKNVMCEVLCKSGRAISLTVSQNGITLQNEEDLEYNRSRGSNPAKRPHPDSPNQAFPRRHAHVLALCHLAQTCARFGLKVSLWDALLLTVSVATPTIVLGSLSRTQPKKKTLLQSAQSPAASPAVHRVVHILRHAFVRVWQHKFAGCEPYRR